MNELNMTVIEAKCTPTHQLFGISFKEVTPGEWLAYWTFPLSEMNSRNEGYGNAGVKGTIVLDGKYPGCPHCHAGTFIHCQGCHKVFCATGTVTSVTCPWCGLTTNVCFGKAYHDISGGKDG